MKNILITILLFALAGCTEEKKMEYKATDIHKLSFSFKNDFIEISYNLPAESLYYSPGVNYIQNEHYMIVNIVRCNIKSKCVVDIDSSGDGLKNIIEIELQHPYNPSQIFFGSKNDSNSLESLVLKTSTAQN